MFNPDQRHWQADKIGDLGNFIIVGVILNQVFNPHFNYIIAIIGFLIAFYCFWYSNRILRDPPRRPKLTYKDDD